VSIARKSLGAPEEDSDVVHGDDETRNSIVGMINSTWDNGIALGMESLPSLIAVRSISLAPTVTNNLSIA
jgi:hypothetical protein